MVRPRVADAQASGREFRPAWLGQAPADARRVPYSRRSSRSPRGRAGGIHRETWSITRCLATARRENTAGRATTARHRETQQPGPNPHVGRRGVEGALARHDEPGVDEALGDVFHIVLRIGRLERQMHDGATRTEIVRPHDHRPLADAVERLFGPRDALPHRDQLHFERALHRDRPSPRDRPAARKLPNRPPRRYRSNRPVPRRSSSAERARPVARLAAVAAVCGSASWPTSVMVVDSGRASVADVHEVARPSAARRRWKYRALVLRPVRLLPMESNASA